jgi:hypothetical protein
MKNFFIVTFLTITFGAAKAQCIRVYVSEKIKGIEIPIQRTEFEVYVNDTLKKKLSSDNSGFLTRLSLNKGKYNIKLVSAEYSMVKMDAVVVEDSKSTDITLVVVPANAADDKKKK